MTVHHRVRRKFHILNSGLSNVHALRQFQQAGQLLFDREPGMGLLPESYCRDRWARNVKRRHDYIHMSSASGRLYRS